MLITKIAGFAPEEKEVVVNTGKLIKDLAMKIESGEIDSLNPEAISLLTAIASIITKVLPKEAE